MTTWLTGARSTGRTVRRAWRSGRSVTVVSAAADLVGTLDALAAALSFPDYFGRNLDALVDCLRDLDVPDRGLTIIVRRAGRLADRDPRGLAGLADALTSIEHERTEVEAVIVDR